MWQQFGNGVWSLVSTSVYLAAAYQLDLIRLLIFFGKSLAIGSGPFTNYLATA